MQAEAVNRMRVFDAAPKRVRDATNAKGEAFLERWWNGLDYQQRKRILAGLRK
jgi:hypothetical protein